MLEINDSVEFSRTSAAVSLALGALFFLAASLIEPAWAPDERAYLEEIAAASNRYQASGVLNALGSTATVFGMVGVLHLLRGRRVTLGQLGAGLVIMGSVLLAGHWLVVLIETAGAQVGPEPGAGAVDDRAGEPLGGSGRRWRTRPDPGLGADGHGTVDTAGDPGVGAGRPAAVHGDHPPACERATPRHIRVANVEPGHCRDLLRPARRRAGRPRPAHPVPARRGLGAVATAAGCGATSSTSWVTSPSSTASSCTARGRSGPAHRASVRRLTTSITTMDSSCRALARQPARLPTRRTQPRR